VTQQGNGSAEGAIPLVLCKKMEDFLKTPGNPSATIMPARSFSLRDFLDRERNLGILLMLPGALLLIVFMAYPIFLGIWLSLPDS